MNRPKKKAKREKTLHIKAAIVGHTEESYVHISFGKLGDQLSGHGNLHTLVIHFHSLLPNPENMIECSTRTFPKMSEVIT